MQNETQVTVDKNRKHRMVLAYVMLGLLLVIIANQIDARVDRQRALANIEDLRARVCDLQEKAHESCE